MGTINWVIPVGEPLADNTESLAKRLFESYKHTNIRETHAGGFDAILEAKLLYFNRTLGATSFGQGIIAIKIEWTLTRPDGRLIWVETVSGHSSGTASVTTEHLLEKAIADLFQKSFDSFQSATAISKFVLAKN